MLYLQFTNIEKMIVIVENYVNFNYIFELPRKEIKQTILEAI